MVFLKCREGGQDPHPVFECIEKPGKDRPKKSWDVIIKGQKCFQVKIKSPLNVQGRLACGPKRARWSSWVGGGTAWLIVGAD